MKRTFVIVCCMFFLCGSAAWALEKCKFDSRHASHGGHHDHDSHAGESSPDKSSNQPDTHPDVILHCPDSDLLIGPMVRLPTGTEFARSLDEGATVAPIKEESSALRPGFIQVRSSGFLNGKSHILFLSILHI